MNYFVLWICFISTLTFAKERALYFPAWPGLRPIQEISSNQVALNYFVPQQTLPKEGSPNKSNTHTATLIFLHGLGGAGEDWMASVAAVTEPHVKIVTPTASKIPFTLKSGAMLNAWFDVKSNESITDEEDEEGIKRSRDAIVKVIEQEIASGILPSRIFLGGFSQGGAMALYTGLTSPYKLGGILALSTWLPLAKTFPAAAANNLDVPIFQGHGDKDELVPYELALMSSTFLRTFMRSFVDFRTYYGLGHSVSQFEVIDAKFFLQFRLPAFFIPQLTFLQN